MTVKKKQRTTLITREGGIVDSLVYWDGKRYKYEPGTGEEFDAAPPKPLK